VKSDPTFDRRIFPRLRTESLISLARLDTATALAHALDLSIGGVRFRCVGLGLRERDIVKVTFTFGERSVTVVGQIVRASELDQIAQEVAIRFLKMNDDTREFLRENLTQREALGSEGDERRALARSSLDSIVAVSRASMVDVVAQAQDLSGGGIHFIVEGLDLELGEVLRITLDCHGTPVSAIGQLVRVTHIDDFKQEAALAFLDVESEAVVRLRKALG